MAERFRQAAEAPIPRTFVTDSLGCQASKDGDACPGRGQGPRRGERKNFSQARTEHLVSTDWKRNGWRATLLVCENFTPLVPVDALGEEQQG